MAISQESVLLELRQIAVPGGGNLVSADMVRALSVENGTVRFVIEAADAATARALAPVEAEAERRLKALPGVLALISAVLILRLAPRVGADPHARPLAELRALRNPAVILTLLVGAIGFGGLFAVYSYLSAAMLATTQPPVWAVAVMLSAFGVGGTLGSIMAARLTIRLGTFGAALVLMLFMALTQALAAAAIGDWALMIGSAFLLGLGSGMVVPLQTRLMDVAGDAQSMAAAMNHAAFNAANALGPLLAGMALTAGWGWRSLGYVGVALSAAGILALGAAWWQSRASGQALENCATRA